MNSRRFIDHLVGAGEQRRRHDEAERLGRRKIDHELEFGRKLYRQIAGLGAFQDLDHGLHGGNTFARVIIPHGTSGTNSRRAYVTNEQGMAGESYWPHGCDLGLLNDKGMIAVCRSTHREDLP